MVLLGFVAILPVTAVLAQSAITSDTEVVITIAGQEHRYQPRPELGYIVKSEENAAAVVGAYEDIRLFTQAPVRPVGGRDRRGIWIVESRRPDSQNQAVIKSLRAQRHVQYAAPLFSCNDETVAIMPEIVVRVTSGSQSEELRELCQVLNLRIKRKMIFTEQEYLIDVLSENVDVVLAVLIELNQIEFVEWAAPNIVSRRKRPEPAVSEMNYSAIQEHLSDARGTSDTSGFIPNDEYFPYQWHLHNTGQFGGTPDADINAPEAWEITAGDPNIVIAVIDIGVESNHPDLVNNLVSGYDFYEDDDCPDPDRNVRLDAHGTACAGIAAAEGNNGIGVVGVAWKCKVMPIRDGTTGSYITWAEEAEAFRWAAANGAAILSNSWGVSSPIPVLHSAIVDITKAGGIGRDGKGCVVFAAAGNQGGAILYPAAYPEVIAVGATDCNDARWSYSNYGPELNLMAPSGCDGEWCGSFAPLWTTDLTGPQGNSIFNDDPNLLDYAQYGGGTSVSCPIAAGVAALILSVEPNLTNIEVQLILERSARDLGEPGRDDYYGWGRVDARAALDLLMSILTDLNNDGLTDFKDFSKLAQYWQQDESSVDIAPPIGDGIVDFKDLAAFAENWLWLLCTRQASNPNPADDATGIVVDANLSWTPGDRAALHKVYFGSDPCALPLVATQPVGHESYDPPGDLIRGTTYYWRIDEVNDAGPHPGKWPGVLWSFTTIPGKAHTPSPADGAVIPGGEIEYPPGSGNWYIYTRLDVVPGPTADPDPNVRRAYFSNNRDDVVNRVQDANLGPPPYASTPAFETTYYAGNPTVAPANDTLVRGTTYYWCVDETDADGYKFPGDIWEFTIQPFYAFAPNPPNDAIFVNPNVVLSWGEGYGAQEHDIYLGTSWDDVNNADANDTTGIYKGYRNYSNYPCSNLELSTRYYWRIDEVQDRIPLLFPGIIYKGDVWSFTTQVPPPPPPP
jgi:subtilisin family serine protease